MTVAKRRIVALMLTAMMAAAGAFAASATLAAGDAPAITISEVQVVE
jgi:hypothetical protein